MSPEEITSRIEKAFRSVFGRRIGFNPQLDRASEPRWTSLKHVEFLIALGVTGDNKPTPATDEFIYREILEVAPVGKVDVGAIFVGVAKELRKQRQTEPRPAARQRSGRPARHVPWLRR